MKLLISLLLLPAVLTTSVNAEDFYDGEWFESTIDMVYPAPNGDFNIRLERETPSCPNRNNFFRIYVGHYGVTEEGSNKMYAAALAAAAQGLTVVVNFEAINRTPIVAKTP